MKVVTADNNDLWRPPSVNSLSCHLKNVVVYGTNEMWRPTSTKFPNLISKMLLCNMRILPNLRGLRAREGGVTAREAPLNRILADNR